MAKEKELSHEEKLARAEKWFNDHYKWSDEHNKYIQYAPLVEGGDVLDPNISNRAKLSKTPLPKMPKKKVKEEEIKEPTEITTEDKPKEDIEQETKDI